MYDFQEKPFKACLILKIARFLGKVDEVGAKKQEQIKKCS